MKHAPLKLFLVARYGNEAEGPNGVDTLFLVRARNHRLAAHVVNKVLPRCLSTRTSPFHHSVVDSISDFSSQRGSAFPTR